MDKKMIRFIDSNYNELFTIPDGGSVVVTQPNGEQYVGICKYLDETHYSINNICYHYCQFAEILESNGSKVEPEKEPQMVSHYRITNRIPVGNKIYILGHSPASPSPYATWQTYCDRQGADFGHYWSNRSDAWSDLLCRADAERTGKYYDHTKRYKKNHNDV